MRFIKRSTSLANTEELLRFQKETGCGPVLSKILFNRGITTPEAYNTFMHPEMPSDDDPFDLPNMQKAVESVLGAIKENRYICIYGDYDVDGVCATYILYKTLRRWTDKVMWYIPSRQNEGYGMHAASIRKLAEQGVQFLITVDNGISAVEEAELAYDLGMKIVITDHHRFTDVLPKAEAIVASSMDGYNTEINDLSGAGVAWMLARALTGEPLREFLPYVALSAAADSVRVTSHNRAYLKNAFPMYLSEPHFKMLLSFAADTSQTVSMRTLNFVFAPRINAAGRMAHADIALCFFLTDDEAQMHACAEKLEELNQARKAEETRIYKACLAQGETKSNVLVFMGDDWNTGVVGIVASRLVETYHKNVFVMGKSPSGEYVGSGRNDSCTDLYALILPCAPVLNRFGGHSGAAGVSVSEENTDAFRAALEKSFEVMYPDGAPTFKTEYDAEISTEDCTPLLAKQIASLAPFGPGNPEPVFRLANASLGRVALMGKGKEHISAYCNNAKDHAETKSLRIVGFGLGNVYTQWKGSSVIDMLVTLDLNSFRNVESCQGRPVSFNMGLLDSEPPFFMDLVNAFFESLRYNDKRRDSLAEKICAVLGYPVLTEERLRQLFVLLYRRYAASAGVGTDISSGTPEEIAALLIFREMGLVCPDNGGIAFLPQDHKKDCRDSLLFSTLNHGGNCNGTR